MMKQCLFICVFVFAAELFAVEAITPPARYRCPTSAFPAALPCPAVTQDTVTQDTVDTAVTRDQLRQRIKHIVNPATSAPPATTTPTTPVIALTSGVVAPTSPLPPPTPRVSLPPMDVSVASFLGVMPGTTTLSQVVSLWGDPQRITDFEGKTAHLYSTEELSHIEVLFESGKVASILVKLDTPLAASQVRESLREELQLVAPVMIPDEQGKAIGELFPERGVFFLFARSPTSREQLVSQIGIEPISTDSFVLRGESTWQSRPSEALRDFLYAEKLVPNVAKTHWFLAKLFLMQGDVRSALQSAERAIALDEQRPVYHLTLAQVLVQLNRANEARQYLEATLTIADAVPHEKALILVMLGDLYRTAASPQCEKAMDIHGEAIRLAAKYLDSPNETIRSVAQEAAFQAHLSAARDVAWGDWNNKDEAISRWLERAAALAATDDATIPVAVVEERLFQLAVCALATQVGTTNTAALESRIEEVLAIGHDLVGNTEDQIRQQKYYWEMGLALYDAVQIFQLRKDFPQALRYGEQSARLMGKGIADRQSQTDIYLLARLYFRLGAIHAIGMKHHRAAIVWFDKAIPVFEPVVATVNAEELGRLGEMFVTMGVSFWEVNQHDRAIALTEIGLQQMDRGVQAGTVLPAALQVPYTNLATMYTKLDRTDDAQRCLQSIESFKQGQNPAKTQR